MNRLEIAVAMLPWFAENSTGRHDATWEQVAVENAFKMADRVLDRVLKADQLAEPKKHVLMYARDCRTCARAIPGPEWKCGSVYQCAVLSRYVSSDPVKLWRN